MLLDDAGSVIDTFKYGTRRSEDWALQLRSIETTLRTELERRDIQSAVVRLRDFFSKKAVDNAVIARCQAEGVILAVVRAYCDTVTAMNGREIGLSLASSKEAVWEEAARLVEPDYVDAAAAALGARQLLQRDD